MDYRKFSKTIEKNYSRGNDYFHYNLIYHSIVDTIVIRKENSTKNATPFQGISSISTNLFSLDSDDVFRHK